MLSDEEALDYARRLAILPGVPRGSSALAEIGIMFASACQTTTQAEILLGALLGLKQWPGPAEFNRIAARLSNSRPLPAIPAPATLPPEWKATLASQPEGPLTTAQLIAACDQADLARLKAIPKAEHEELAREAGRMLDAHAEENPGTMAHRLPYRADNIRLGVLALHRRRHPTTSSP